MDKERFLHAYQSVKFQEDDADAFSTAAIRRKCLAINFLGSVHLKEDDDTTCLMLDNDLHQYEKAVDNHNPGKVNNYAESVLSLMSSGQNENKKQWKTSLQDSKLSDFVKPLMCSGQLDCRNLKISNNIIQEFTKAKSSYSQEKDSRRYDFEKPQLHNNVLPKNSSSQNFNRSVQIGVSSVGNTNIPKVMATPDSPSRSTDRYQVHSFKTASDELRVQNAKKFGRSVSNNPESSSNYGQVKKCLGTRKGNVFNKFQPPVRGREEYDAGGGKLEQPDEEVDERLKNIDPKMIELIKNEIMDCGSKIGWSDIAGLELAKTTIQEIVVWPMLRPDIFTGLRRPPKGILLFGPPGTGKTLIGKCIASQSNSTFFSISASSLTSKWIGESEKMVRALFAVAKCHQPAVVFVDEIDSLLKQRNDSEHECTRRIKTEFLVQLDGAGTGEEDRILIIGATNRPQELDEAARRRLVKRLYIPLPDETARKQIVENLISTERHCLSDEEIQKIARLTEGYSGADVKNLCQEASLGPIRSIPPSEIANINPNAVRPLSANDFKSALTRIKSSVSETDLDTYIEWDKKFGCGSSFQ